MKNWKRITALTLVLVLLVSSMTGCSAQKTEVLDKLDEFTYACRNLDVDALLNCIDPDIAEPIKMGLVLFSTATGQDYEDVIDGILIDLVGSIFGSDYDPDAFLSTLTISNPKVTVRGKQAKIRCVIGFEIAGKKLSREATIVMAKEQKKWYVANVDFFA